MSTAWEKYSDICNQCSELKLQGNWAEQIPLRKQAIELAQPFGSKRVASAWAQLAYVYLQTGQYSDAETSIITAIDNHDDSQKNPEEILASLQFLHARILVAQERFEEAVIAGEEALSNFRVFHSPPTDFLRDRTSDVAQMRAQRDRRRGGDNKTEIASPIPPGVD